MSRVDHRWDNCGPGDDETAAIDEMERLIAPVGEDAARIRGLISALECCHCRAAHRVDNIIEAIATGRTDKGPGKRPPGAGDGVEAVWRHAWAALSAWCAGCPADSLDIDIGGVAASDLVSLVGARTQLKEWQCARVADKLRPYATWPAVLSDKTIRYVEMSEYAEGERGHAEFREYYGEHRDELRTTVRTVIHDTVDAKVAQIPLAAAIDHLEPCNWNFTGNLRIVLAAIGGDLRPAAPFAAHARNRRLNPACRRLRTVAATLRAFLGRDPGEPADESILARLGERTDVKAWLAASLEKTLRSQAAPIRA